MCTCVHEPNWSHSRSAFSGNRSYTITWSHVPLPEGASAYRYRGLRQHPKRSPPRTRRSSSWSNCCSYSVFGASAHRSLLSPVCLPSDRKPTTTGSVCHAISKGYSTQLSAESQRITPDRPISEAHPPEGTASRRLGLLVSDSAGLSMRCCGSTRMDSWRATTPKT